MANPLIFRIIYVLAITIGSISNSSAECTLKKIDDCYNQNFNAHGHCPYSNLIMTCIHKFVNDCEGNLLVAATSVLKYQKTLADVCPGLPDGICYFYMIGVCTRGIPMNEVLPTIKNPSKKACDKLKSKSYLAKSCLNRVKARCHAAKARHELNETISSVDSSLKSCASVHG